MVCASAATVWCESALPVLAWTHKAGLNYHYSKDLLAYASYSTRFKDGGYNYSAFFSPSYGPEYVDATEVGIKSQWLANRLQVNLSGLYYDYKDKQEVVAVDVSQGANYIVNAASARVDGVELEVVAQPTRALGIDATLSYLDAKYGDFQAFDLSFP